MEAQTAKVMVKVVAKIDGHCQRITGWFSEENEAKAFEETEKQDASTPPFLLDAQWWFSKGDMAKEEADAIAAKAEEKRAEEEAISTCERVKTGVQNLKIETIVGDMVRSYTSEEIIYMTMATSLCKMFLPICLI